MYRVVPSWPTEKMVMTFGGQRGGQPRLVVEPGEKRRVEAPVVWEHLDGDLPRQVRVARTIHRAHPAGTDGRQGQVLPEEGARS